MKFGVGESPWATKYPPVCFQLLFFSCRVWVSRRVKEKAPVCDEGGHST